MVVAINKQVNITEVLATLGTEKYHSGRGDLTANHTCFIACLPLIKVPATVLDFLLHVGKMATENGDIARVGAPTSLYMCVTISIVRVVL